MGLYDEFRFKPASWLPHSELPLEELERISIAVETLQLWSERMLATGAIDVEQYNAYKDK